MRHRVCALVVGAGLLCGVMPSTGCSTPPLAAQGEPVVTPLERMPKAEPGTETEPEPTPAEVDTATRPEDDVPAPDPGDDRPELSRDPGVPAWFHDELREDDGVVFAGGTALSDDVRAARRAALERGRAALSPVVGPEAAARAEVTRGAVYRVAAGYRVYVMLGASRPGEDEE